MPQQQQQHSPVVGAVLDRAALAQYVLLRISDQAIHEQLAVRRQQQQLLRQYPHPRNARKKDFQRERFWQGKMLRLLYRQRLGLSIAQPLRARQPRVAVTAPALDLTESRASGVHMRLAARQGRLALHPIEMHQGSAFVAELETRLGGEIARMSVFRLQLQGSGQALPRAADVTLGQQRLPQKVM